MDLTEAEAVIDLIDAQSAAAAKNAAAQLDGGLRRRLEPVQEALIDITSRFYAVVDYPDEDIEDIQPQQIRSSLQIAADTLSALLDTAQRGRVLKNGVRTAIVGLPNAGKSSLLNALAGYDRAIVTDIPGTTRDTVEEKVTVGGVLLRLIDTAGIRDGGDAVETMGVERSRAAAKQASLALLVLDGSRELTAEEAQALYDAAWRDIRAENVLPVDGDYAWLGVEITLFGDGDSRTISSTKSSYKELTQALLDLGIPAEDIGEINID